jgi:hypothetical protein
VEVAPEGGVEVKGKVGEEAVGLHIKKIKYIYACLCYMPLYYKHLINYIDTQIKHTSNQSNLH